MFLIGYSSKKEVLAEETQMEIPLSPAEFFFSGSVQLCSATLRQCAYHQKIKIHMLYRQ